jgi:hypothetical protein
MTPSHPMLRLVEDDEYASPGTDDAVVPVPSDLLLDALRQIGVLPLVPTVLQALVPVVEADVMDQAAKELERAGRARRVLVGRTWHLVEVPGPPSTVHRGPAGEALSAPSTEGEVLERVHRAQVGLDIARERLLVMRVLAVLTTVAALVLGREITLALLAL